MSVNIEQYKPIGSQLVFSNVSSDSSTMGIVKKLTPFPTYIFKGIKARISFEAKDVFAGAIIGRCDFDATTNFNLLNVNTGVPIYDGDILELENIEQITAFNFITEENGKQINAWVQYFALI